MIGLSLRLSSNKNSIVQVLGRRLRRQAAFKAGAIALLCGALVACGGGGGGGGGGDAPAPAPGSATPPPTTPTTPTVADAPNSYLPTGAQIRWNYGGPELYFSQSAVIDGRYVHTLLYPTGGKEYWTTAADQLALQGLYLPSIQVGDGVTYTGDIRFANLLTVHRNDWMAGLPQSVSGSGEITIAPTYGRRTVNYAGQVIYVGEEIVSTALGSFLARRVNIDVMLTSTVDGTTFSIPYNVTFWFAKDVGIVKREQGSSLYLLTSLTGLNVSPGGTGSDPGAGPGTGGDTGGGTGPGGGGNPGSGAPAPNYFPVDRGYLWYFDGITMGHARFYSESLSGALVDTWRYSYNSPGSDYYVASSTGASVKGFFDFSYHVPLRGVRSIRAVFDQMLPVWDNAWSAPQTLPLSGSADIEVRNDLPMIPTIQHMTLPFSGTVQYLGEETLAIGAGNVVTKHVMLDISMDMDVENSQFTYHYVLNLWLAEGVGIVRWGNRVLSGTSGFWDRDNDGVFDPSDAFPDDATETTDTDGDGIGDNADTDDDNDGTLDADDLYPLDATRW